MPIIKKPDHIIFASEAKKGELSDFPNLLRGWGVTIDQTAGKPPMEWFNTLQKRTDEWLTYLSQRGISEWDNTLDYPKNAVVQSEGKFYVSIRENKAKAPDKSQSDWQPMADALNIKIEDATLKNKGMVQLSSATDSTDETMAATPKAVKAAYDMAASPAVKSVNGKKGEVRLTPDDIGAFSNAGGTVKGEIISQGGQISLKGDDRKHLGFHNQDGSVRMWLYKNKGGDGVRLNNGDDGGGDYIFHKDGGFRSPSSVYAGAARMAADGNIYGSVWGGYLSEWLHNHMLQGVPAGIPLPFPGEDPPSGWLKCNGQAFNKTTYPVLASLYPTGKLPDLRGEFIRGWDDGRKVDTGRELVSAQGDAIRNMTGTIGQLNDRVTDTNTKGVFAATSYTGGDAGLSGGSAGRIVTFDPSTVVPTANENRPRNIAFNYIVRAA